MKNVVNPIVNNRVTELFKSLCYFSDDTNVNFQNYIEGLKYVKNWLPVIQSVACIELAVNDRCEIADFFIDQKFHDKDDDYFLNTENNIIEIKFYVNKMDDFINTHSNYTSLSQIINVDGEEGVITLKSIFNS